MKPLLPTTPFPLLFLLPATSRYGLLTLWGRLLIVYHTRKADEINFFHAGNDKHHFLRDRF